MAAKEEQFIQALSVLSESVRYQILSQIASSGELTAKDILEQFDFTQPTLSHHMAVLTEAGLVNVERRGRFAYYSINRDTIELISSGISSLKPGSKNSAKFGSKTGAKSGSKQGSKPGSKQGSKPGSKKSGDDSSAKDLKKGKKKKKKDKNKKKKKD